MTFTDIMKAELAKPLDRKAVRPPAPGKYGEYVEGWHVIAEANRIFGFDGWARETVEIVEVCRYETEVGREKKPGWAVGYRAKVRVTAHGVVREGSAVGNGVSVQLYDAIESAAKEAETDAMKRALMTFGNPLGLALYDKTKANVADAPVAMMSEDQRDIITTTAAAAGVSLQAICKRYSVSDILKIEAGAYDEIIEGLKLTIETKKQKVTA